MSSIQCSHGDLWRRLEEQEQELESLREQRRDKDAAITFLKTRITTLQNKVQVHSDRQGTGNEDAMEALVLDRERQIDELECRLASAQREIQRWSQGSTRADEATSAAQALRQQLQEQDTEVEALRASLERCHEELQATHQQGAAEIQELRHRLQMRDEQVHALGVAIEELQQRCHTLGGGNGEELHRVIEENHCLSTSLEQATMRVGDLQIQLQEKEQEVDLLAGELQTLQQELAECRRQQQSQEQPWAARFRKCGDTEFAPLEGGETAAAAAASRTPKPSQTVPGRRPRTPPPLPRMPSSHGEATPTAEFQPEVYADPGAADGPSWQEQSLGSCSARGHREASLRLQERRDTVLLLEEEIHKQIAQHRNSRGRESAELSKEAGPIGSQTPCASAGSGVCLIHLQMAPGEGDDHPHTRPEPDNYPQELTPEEVLAPTQKPCAVAALHVQRPGRQEEEAPGNEGSPATCTSAVQELRAQSSKCSAKCAPENAGSDERPGKPPTGGGVLVSLNFFDQEDSRAKKAKQQRVARQIEQRRRLTKEKARPEEATCRPRPGEEAGPPVEVVLPAERSPGLLSRSALASSAGTPRRASCTALPSAGPQVEREAPATPQTALLEGRETASAAGRRAAPASKDDLAVPSLHDRFASLRDEMKRQRGGQLDQQQSARAAESALSLLMQQRSASRLLANRGRRRDS